MNENSSILSEATGTDVSSTEESQSKLKRKIGPRVSFKVEQSLLDELNGGVFDEFKKSVGELGMLPGYTDCYRHIFALGLKEFKSQHRIT
jgi:hypothetical protein